MNAIGEKINIDIKIKTKYSIMNLEEIAVKVLYSL